MASASTNALEVHVTVPPHYDAAHMESSNAGTFGTKLNPV